MSLLFHNDIYISVTRCCYVLTINCRIIVESNNLKRKQRIFYIGNWLKYIKFASLIADMLNEWLQNTKGKEYQNVKYVLVKYMSSLAKETNITCKSCLQRYPNVTVLYQSANHIHVTTLTLHSLHSLQFKLDLTIKSNKLTLIMMQFICNWLNDIKSHCWSKIFWTHANWSHYLYRRAWIVTSIHNSQLCVWLVPSNTMNAIT